MQEILNLLGPYTNIALAGVFSGIVAFLKATGIKWLDWGKFQGVMALTISLAYFLVDYFIPTFGDPSLTLVGAVLWAVGTGLMATGWHSQLKNSKEGLVG